MLYGYQKILSMVNFVSIKRASKCVLLLVFIVQGCGSVPPRNALPEELSKEASIPGMLATR